MKFKKHLILLLKDILYISFGLVVILTYPISYKLSQEDIEITVSNKENITVGYGEHIEAKFIIYTKDEVFENVDSWLFFKFNSSDLQNNLEVNNTYKVKVAGWRIPFCSMHRNIVSLNKNKHI